MLFRFNKGDKNITFTNTDISDKNLEKIKEKRLKLNNIKFEEYENKFKTLQNQNEKLTNENENAKEQNVQRPARRACVPPAFGGAVLCGLRRGSRRKHGVFRDSRLRDEAPGESREPQSDRF